MNLCNTYPKSDYQEMTLLLKSQEPSIVAQRERVRKILAEIDPQGIASQWTVTAKRRVYRVLIPNFLWHLDTNHRLIRYPSNFLDDLIVV